MLDKIKQELERGFTKRELEVLMGIPKNNLSGILKGKKKISAKGLIRIQKYFDLEKMPIPSEKIEKVKRMVIENNKPANKARIEAERNKVKDLPPEIRKQPLMPSEMVNRHKLWKQGDPKENSGAFFLKYDCGTYNELENKLK